MPLAATCVSERNICAWSRWSHITFSFSCAAAPGHAIGWVHAHKSMHESLHRVVRALGCRAHLGTHMVLLRWGPVRVGSSVFGRLCAGILCCSRAQNMLAMVIPSLQSSSGGQARVTAALSSRRAVINCSAPSAHHAHGAAPSSHFVAPAHPNVLVCSAPARSVLACCSGRAISLFIVARSSCAWLAAMCHTLYEWSCGIDEHACTMLRVVRRPRTTLSFFL